jgi:hypothetical protein
MEPMHHNIKAINKTDAIILINVNTNAILKLEILFISAFLLLLLLLEYA